MLHSLAVTSPLPPTPRLPGLQPPLSLCPQPGVTPPPTWLGKSFQPQPTWASLERPPGPLGHSPLHLFLRVPFSPLVTNLQSWDGFGPVAFPSAPAPELTLCGEGLVFLKRVLGHGDQIPGTRSCQGLRAEGGIGREWPQGKGASKASTGFSRVDGQ